MRSPEQGFLHLLAHILFILLKLTPDKMDEDVKTMLARWYEELV
jgi:hypothetical protein